MASLPLNPLPEPEIAGVVIPWFSSADRPGRERVQETTGLVQALGCSLSFLRPVHVRQVNPSHLLSGGLLDLFAEDLLAAKATLAVVDGALTPVQQRNLENRLGLKVIDRTGLILEIFGLRARTREGRLQVELARILYERSRLVRTWTHLERQRGGGGFLSGPGESQIESDRRMLDDRILRLRRDISEVRRTRSVQRAGRLRGGRPVIALVGYTNSGKSTLFNKLTGANVLAQDMPFATLDTTIRRLDLPVLGEAVLIDTVGFISDLPTHLVESFQATLEEILHADLLVHVRDRTSGADREQADEVMKVLHQLEAETGLHLPPIVEAWNKSDKVEFESLQALQLAADEMETEPRAAIVSGLTGKGIPSLLKLIDDTLVEQTPAILVRLEPCEGKARAWLHQHGEVLVEEADKSGVTSLQVRLRRDRIGQFRAVFPHLAEVTTD